MKERKQIHRIAILSRILIIFWQAISNWILPDHIADAFVSPTNLNKSATHCDLIFEKMLSGFRRWDSEYFLHIAEHDYTYENTLAFYPLFPHIVRYTTYIIQVVNPIECSFREMILIVAVALNVFFFIKAASTLFDLTEEIFKDRTFARIAVTLFCFNPASIFFSAPYTECLFCWLSFCVMLNCLRGNILFAALPLMLGLWCRSNGTVNFGFILFYAIKAMFSGQGFSKCLQTIFKVVVSSIIGLLAVFAVHFYHFKLYCKENNFKMPEYVRQYGIENDLVMAGKFNAGKSPWCLKPLSFSYSYVQSQYWNVGFLRYYEFKQIPNFLLAAPILILIISHSISYLIKNTNITFRLGLWCKDCVSIDIKQFVYVVHALVLSIICLLFVHIQVSTRMLASSSPYVYWICAKYFYNERNRYNGIQLFLQSNTKMTKFISCWFLGYFIVGTAMFSNFLPWT